MNGIMTDFRRFGIVIVVLILAVPARGEETLGLVIERASGAVLMVDVPTRTLRERITGLGDLSHASVEFSRNHAFIFGRDGGLSKVDLRSGQVVGRVLQAGNSIGGAISGDGHLVAVANYVPGGVRVFTTGNLALVADSPAVTRDGMSKVVGLVAAGPRQFVFSLYEAGEIWILDLTDLQAPVLRRYEQIGRYPYDAFLTPDKRYYVVGLFGEAAMALLDLWHPETGVRRVLSGYRNGQTALPVYKMPHLAGWTVAGTSVLFPAVGAHEVLVADATTWTLQEHIPVAGQPVFVISRRHEAWVNFALPDNDTIQVIDVARARVVHTFKPGHGVMHMASTPDGREMWISLRDENKVVIHDANTHERIGEIQALAPSGIFLTSYKVTGGR